MAKSIKRNRNTRKKSRRINNKRRIRSRSSLKKIKGGDDNKITVVSYNILDVDLESNFVPRTMDGKNQKKLKEIPLISVTNDADIHAELGKLSEVFDKLFLHTKEGQTNKEFVADFIINVKSNKKEYTLYDLAGNLYSTGFHSGGKIKKDANGEPLNKIQTRQFWGESSAADFVTTDDKKTVNLRKMLTEGFIKSLYTPPESSVNDASLNEIWKSILDVNDAERKWTKRGPRIVQNIQSKTPDIICLQEYGNCKNKNMTDIGDDSVQLNAEYDEQIKALDAQIKALDEQSNDELKQQKDELNEQKRQRLDALENEQVKTDLRKDTLPYKLINLNNTPTYEYKFFGYNPDTTNGDDGVAIFYKTGNFVFKKSISINMDAENVTENAQPDKKPYTTLRRAGLLVLEHNPSKQIFIICTAHLQSDSNERANANDDGKKNRVKTLELKSISEQILKTYNKYTKPPNVIFCGDFNLNMLIKPPNKDGVQEPSKLHIKTATGKTEILNENKFNISTPLILTRVKPEPDLDFTTYSSREEYIDFFYSNMTGSFDTKDVYQIKEEMPNKTEPSDHIMITAKF